MSNPVQIHLLTPIQPRGLVIYEGGDENEPKTLLEIGGVSRPNPTYPVMASGGLLQTSRPAAVITSLHQSPPSHQLWASEDTQESIPSQYAPYAELQEQKALRLTNSSWNLADRRKLSTKKSPDRGKFNDKFLAKSTIFVNFLSDLSGDTVTQLRLFSKKKKKTRCDVENSIVWF